MSNATAAVLLERAPVVYEAYDTTTPAFEAYTNWLADYMVSHQISIQAADDILRSEQNADPARVIAARTALKVIAGDRDAAWVESYAIENKQSICVTFVLPAYHEAARMQPRSKSNPHGEDALAYKVSYLMTLHDKYPHIIPRLVVVDDGCDGQDGTGISSGKAAEARLDALRPSFEAHVIYLADHIAKKSSIVPQGLHSAASSLKGGAVLAGLAYASKVWPAPRAMRHILIVSDMDASVHPAHCPTFARTILETDCIVATGSRFEPESVQCIQSDRRGPGELYAAVWRQLLPTLAKSSNDASRGFLAIDSQFAPQLYGTVANYSFIYQAELLLVAAQQGRHKLQAVPVAYIDSSALSNFQDGSLPQTYFEMACAVANSAERHGELSPPELVRSLRTAAKTPEAAELWWGRVAKDRCTVTQLIEEAVA